MKTYLPRRAHARLVSLFALSVSSVACGSGASSDDGTTYVEDPGRIDTEKSTPDSPAARANDQNPLTTDPEEVKVTDPDDGIDFGDVPIEVSDVTSSSATLRWDAISSAESIQIMAGPEPLGDAETMPVEIELATLDGGATETTVNGIAAGTDLFVRLVAKTKSGDQWGIAHVRTKGGPREKLDTPLRSVHAMGPAIVELVLETKETEFDGGNLTGARGAAWQGGQWSVMRADGSPIAVKAVHRRSIPVGQPSYPVGYEKWGDQDIVDVDDHVFLELEEDIGSVEMLRITHEGNSDTGLDVTVPFSDRYLETPLLKVNQVGYNPRATERYAYVNGFLGDGGDVDLSTLPTKANVLADARNALREKRVVEENVDVQERSENDPESGGPVGQIDLARVPAAEGARYRVQLPGVGISYPTAVSDEAALRAYYVVARGLFHNRWCGDLGSNYTEWSRSPDHCSAYFVEGRSYTEEMFPESTPRSNEKPVVGGHHDAGDFDIRPFHVVVAEYLMRAYETNPEAFSDGRLDVPESGNGIPDLLDEALYSIRAWEDLQNSNGSIRAGAESSHHPRGIYYADEDELAYWTFDPEPWHTAYVAALFAQASHLVKPFDADKSANLLDRSKDAYSWAKSNGADQEFLLYAASELSRATEDAEYGSDFENLYEALGGQQMLNEMRSWANIYPGSFTGNAPVLADYTMGYAASKVGNPDIQAAIRDAIASRAEGAAQRIINSSHAMRNGRPAELPPDWGNSVSSGKHADGIYQNLPFAEGEQRQAEFNALSLSADYVLGANPAGMSYITGLGSVSPQEPLHTDSLAFIKDRGMPPVPGIPVYGPVQNFPGPTWYDALEAAFHPSFDQTPLGMHHLDSRTAVNMSEFSVWESQAPLTALFATLAPAGDGPDEWKAGGAEHRSPLPPHRLD